MLDECCSSRARYCARGSIAIPRDYNFADDILRRNLEAGRAGKPAYIDPRGQLDLRPARRAGRALRQRAARARRCAARSACSCACSTPSTSRPCSSAPSRRAPCAVPVNTLLTEDDYRFMLTDSRARVLVVSRRALSEARAG